MSLVDPKNRLELPSSLEAQLHDFKRLVWKIKLIEGVCIALCGLFSAYLAVFILDRFGETPRVVRGMILLGAIAIGGFIPYVAYRWIWQNRRLEQLARLLSRKLPRIGDQLLGVIELVRNESEQARSRALCEAAIEQTAVDASKRDFRTAVPSPRHKFWGKVAAIPITFSVLLLIVCWSAAGNAWGRFLSPWSDTPRYTFASIEKLANPLIVPHGEPVEIKLALNSDSRWHPREGTLRVGNQPEALARLKNSGYEFSIPPQIDETGLKVSIGDAVQRVRMVPTIRPELTSLTADYTLPEYLGRTGTEKKDARSGAITLVKGSQVEFTAKASRELASATVNGTTVTPTAESLKTEGFTVEISTQLEIQWKDRLGLEGKDPFTLSLTARDDEAPTVGCEDLPRQKVVLESEQLSFRLHANDDFGVKRVGLEWNGINQDGTPSQMKGERILAAGGSDKETLELAGTFSATTLGIEAQPIQLRIFAEDYFPGRERAYSLPYTLFILTADEHAVWITEQMNKWHRQSLEVRDRELQLHEVNKQLRELTKEELDRPENRRKLEQQANAERANGRRLTGLVQSGEELVRQAARNPEFGVGHLEKWAEMLQILKDISGNRMPSVADLLKEGAQAPVMASRTPLDSKAAGKIRSNPQGGKPTETKEEKNPPPSVPKLTDVESTQGSKDPSKEEKEESPEKKKASAGKFGLPTTMIPETSPSKPQPKKPETPAEEKVEEAIKEQADLLAEFDKIADELEKVLANLEGSTLVKRLKAASRKQYKIGGQISELVGDAFGVAENRIEEKAVTVFKDLSEQESKASLDMSYIMDDLQAYLERRQLERFRTVLEEMRKQDAIGGLRQLGDDLKKENGLSLAQSEFWSDTFDRWADDLADPACAGKCPGCKSKGSLPPSIVLEVLQVLEAEVNLREETRVTQQSKPAVKAEDYGKHADQLSETQKTLQDRIKVVVTKIEELPDAEEDFGKELRLLGLVASVMGEATEILARPETGNPAIAAETEAIELLLQSKKFNPKGGGGGGGSTPGGGGGGTTSDSALALLGSGVNQKEVREDRGTQQATGDSGPVLPEEFRAGLDEYFNRLERGTSEPIPAELPRNENE